MKPMLAALGCALLFASACSSTPTQSVNEKKTDILLTAGIEQLQAGQFTLALSSLLEAKRYSPKNAVIISNIGLAYAGKKEFRLAEDSWKKALQLDPQLTDARLNLGVLALKERRLAEAERYLKDASKDLAYGQLDQVAYQLALVHLAQNRPLLAEQQLKIAVRERSNHCPAWQKLGMIQKERGDYEEAARSLSRSVFGTCYKNPESHYEIATLFLKERDLPQAKSKFLEIIQLFPNSEWAKKAEISLNMIR